MRSSFSVVIVLLNVNIALLSIAGYRVWSFADPIGAIVISMYIIGSWAVAGWGKFVHVTVFYVVRHHLRPLIGGGGVIQFNCFSDVGDGEIDLIHEHTEDKMPLIC